MLDLRKDTKNKNIRQYVSLEPPFKRASNISLDFGISDLKKPYFPDFGFQQV